MIIDGGTGTQLQGEGMPTDEQAWSGRANLEEPEAVQRVHEAYLRAGAEVIITNTFAASRAALEAAGLGERVADANRNAVVAALRARAVAGSMSPFGLVAMHSRNEAGPAGQWRKPKKGGRGRTRRVPTGSPPPVRRHG